MDRKRKEKARELGITHHSKKEDDKQQHAEVRQDAREDDDKRSARTTKYHRVLWTRAITNLE